MKFSRASTVEEYEAAAVLFKEYAAGLAIDLCFQHFDEELQQLQIMYGPPGGAILLCSLENKYIGCVAVRKIDLITAELKRMYVLPAFRHLGIGRELMSRSLDIAREFNYKKIRLDTLSTMTTAINLYKQNGFREIAPYYHNPESTAVFFEKDL